ncbi:MAG TPA: response regulator [Nitrospirae bacterium]|nr:cell cycle response regulator CtrA [bacterium BMS3Abin09]GBE41734.1 cell cycle response regulator CtrA [bacterium BMS3Bbin09]HDN94945.1 response regulator [Nitrospirota bacterium]HDO67670.1 response regulator [Nitrospirota bacterium]HDZ83991.1 response regulator [Nitrospirota bacterium]
MEKKGKILILDDDPVVTLSCKRILGAEGYNITTVDKGDAALNKLAKEDFDLFISDVMLPDISGMEVLKEARIIKPQTDVVIITGYPRLEDAKEASRLGARQYLEKPFTPDFMVNVAKKVFDKRGWILRQTFIDEFRDSVVSLNEQDNPVIFYKEGTWARPAKDGMWEIGCDLRYWILSGALTYVDFVKGQDKLTAGEKFASIYSSTGQSNDLLSPMNADLREINTKANDVMAALLKDHLSEGWLLWLAKVFPLETV